MKRLALALAATTFCYQAASAEAPTESRQDSHGFNTVVPTTFNVDDFAAYDASHAQTQDHALNFGVVHSNQMDGIWIEDSELYAYEAGEEGGWGQAATFVGGVAVLTLVLLSVQGSGT